VEVRRRWLISTSLLEVEVPSVLIGIIQDYENPHPLTTLQRAYDIDSNSFPRAFDQDYQLAQRVIEDKEYLSTVDIYDRKVQQVFTEHLRFRICRIFPWAVSGTKVSPTMTDVSDFSREDDKSMDRAQYVANFASSPYLRSFIDWTLDKDEICRVINITTSVFFSAPSNIETERLEYLKSLLSSVPFFDWAKSFFTWLSSPDHYIPINSSVLRFFIRDYINQDCDWKHQSTEECTQLRDITKRRIVDHTLVIACFARKLAGEMFFELWRRKNLPESAVTKLLIQTARSNFNESLD
jgi:hypothetical protein